MSDVLQIVYDNLYSRIVDPTYGYNARIAASVPSRYTTLDPAKMQINFTPSVGQFYGGEIDPDELDATTPHPHLSLMTLWTDSGQNGQRVKFEEFSGIVNAFAQISFTFRGTKLTTNDFETPVNAAVDAFLRTVNDPAVQGWSSPVAYNGDISFKKSPVVKGRDMWLRYVRFRMVFELDQQ